MAYKKLEQATTALKLTAKVLSSPMVLELPTPYVELNWQQLLLPSRTLFHTLLQAASPLFIKYANQVNNSVADTGIPAAGPGHGGIPFSHLFWLAKEEKREQTAGTSTALAPNPIITYLPNLQNALKSHMHTKHRLGYADFKTGYNSYYQSLLPHVEENQQCL
eukprot:1153974-Pelagomonas_calceolata.AAC.2